jgi:hypothetical protein
MPRRGLPNDYSWNSKRMLIKMVLRRPKHCKECALSVKYGPWWMSYHARSRCQ